MRNARASRCIFIQETVYCHLTREHPHSHAQEPAGVNWTINTYATLEGHNLTRKCKLHSGQVMLWSGFCPQMAGPPHHQLGSDHPQKCDRPQPPCIAPPASSTLQASGSGPGQQSSCPPNGGGGQVTSGTNTKIQCFNCKEYGHYTSHCLKVSAPRLWAAHISKSDKAATSPTRHGHDEKTTGEADLPVNNEVAKEPPVDKTTLKAADRALYKSDKQFYDLDGSQYDSAEEYKAPWQRRLLTSGNDSLTQYMWHHQTDTLFLELGDAQQHHPQLWPVDTLHPSGNTTGAAELDTFPAH